MEPPTPNGDNTIISDSTLGETEGTVHEPEVTNAKNNRNSNLLDD